MYIDKDNCGRYSINDMTAEEKNTLIAALNVHRAELVSRLLGADSDVFDGVEKLFLRAGRMLKQIQEIN